MNTKFGGLSDEDKAKLFIAWTKEETIQCRRDLDVEWVNTPFPPNWNEHLCYRVKPEEPINTIDWSLIHPDYNHLAKDANGEWWLYIDTPTPERNSWEGNTRIRSFPLDAITFFNPKEVDWKKSLISRPDIT